MYVYSQKRRCFASGPPQCVILGADSRVRWCDLVYNGYNLSRASLNENCSQTKITFSFYTAERQLEQQVFGTSLSPSVSENHFVPGCHGASLFRKVVW